MCDSAVIIFDFIHAVVWPLDGSRRPPAPAPPAPSSSVVLPGALVRAAKRHG